VATHVNIGGAGTAIGGEWSGVAEDQRSRSLACVPANPPIDCLPQFLIRGMKLERMV
jgi:hypothetical protein